MKIVNCNYHNIWHIEFSRVNCKISFDKKEVYASKKLYFYTYKALKKFDKKYDIDRKDIYVMGNIVDEFSSAVKNIKATGIDRIEIHTIYIVENTFNKMHSYPY